jgi:type VI secretion system protein ImpA
MSTAAEGLNFDNLLAPIEGDNPAGQDPRTISIGGKGMLMAEIEEKRRAILGGVNENVEQGSQVDSQELTRQRRSEWKEVERMLQGTFSKGKELGTAVLFVQAAVSSRGWSALAPGLRLIRQLQENFWETLYPLPETDDNGNPDYLDRLVAMERMDHENFLPLALRQLSFTDPKAGYDFSWADQKQLEILKGAKPAEGEDPDAKRRMVDERTQAFEAALAKSNLAFYDGLVGWIRDAVSELGALRELVDERYAASPDEDRPTFRRISETLEECQNMAERLWRKKGGGAGEAEGAESEESSNGAGGGAIGAPVSDHDVVGLLERALSSLKAHHRHNPAAFLVEEAIRWTRMPISTWYLEASEDPSMSGFISKLMRGGASAPQASESE